MMKSDILAIEIVIWYITCKQVFIVKKIIIADKCDILLNL